MLSIPLSTMHPILNNDGPFLFTLANHVLIYPHIHLSIRLISSHLPKYCRADRALRPLLLSNHTQQTLPVILMGAVKHEYILIWVCRALLLEIPNLKLLKANHALFILHLTLSQYELQRREESEWESHLRSAGLMLLLDKVGEILNDVEILRDWSQFVFASESDLLKFRGLLNHFEILWRGLHCVY